MDMEIKRIRIALGMTQSQFAQKLALKPSAIGNYEMGIRKPKIIHARHIVNFAKSRGIQTSLDAIYSINSAH